MSSRFQHCRPSRLNRPDFIARFGGVYEHSPWIAEAAYDAGLGPEADEIDVLHGRMAAILLGADRGAQLSVLRAHPDLAGKAAVAGQLTVDSRREQAGAGIDQCSAAEFARFGELNGAYRQKFGFPFIMAVTGAGKAEILAAFETRIHHGIDEEFALALAQVNKIAGFRLQRM